jgi:N-acetylglucosaminyldiphosphoundecaprenol N-acetyl-beta-D-mannosaminyltransferase
VTSSTGLLNQVLARKKHRSIDILGVRVDDVTLSEALPLLEAMVLDGNAHQVVTVNSEFIMTAQTNPAFRDVLNKASLALPDSIGVVWASRLLGHPLTERVAGVETVERLAMIAQRKKMRVFLLGAAPGVADLAAERLREQLPGLIIAGTYSGSPQPEEEFKICGLIEAADPQILFVAYGAPNQDLWIARNLHRFTPPIVAVGVGGTLDYIAGVAVRAPQWMQRVGLEWLHRLIHEPHRWRRMLALPKFCLAVFQQRVKKDWSQNNGAR